MSTRCGFPTPKTLYKPLPPPLKYPYPWKGYGFALGKGKGRCENTHGLPVPITMNIMIPSGVLTLAPFLLFCWLSIKLPLLKRFRPGTSGGLGMVRYFTFSSHGCHLLCAPNFLAWVLPNLDVTLHNLFTERSSVFLVELILIPLQSFVMSLLLYFVLPLVLPTMSLAGDPVSIT